MNTLTRTLRKLRADPEILSGAKYLAAIFALSIAIAVGEEYPQHRGLIWTIAIAAIAAALVWRLVCSESVSKILNDEYEREYRQW